MKYSLILYIVYFFNILLICNIELMLKNILIFNYKNTIQFSKNNFFFDILIKYYFFKNINKFIKIY